MEFSGLEDVLEDMLGDDECAKEEARDLYYNLLEDEQD